MGTIVSGVVAGVSLIRSDLIDLAEARFRDEAARG